MKDFKNSSQSKFEGIHSISIKLEDNECDNIDEKRNNKIDNVNFDSINCKINDNSNNKDDNCNNLQYNSDLNEKLNNHEIVNNEEDLYNKRFYMLLSTVCSAFSRIFIKLNTSVYPNIETIYFTEIRCFFLFISSHFQTLYIMNNKEYFSDSNKNNSESTKSKDVNITKTNSERNIVIEKKVEEKMNNITLLIDSIKSLFDFNSISIDNISLKTPLILLWLRIISLSIAIYITYDIYKNIKIGIASIILMSSSLFTTISFSYIKGTQVSKIYYISFLIILLSMSLLAVVKDNKNDHIDINLHENISINNKKEEFKPNLIYGLFLSIIYCIMFTISYITTYYLGNIYDSEKSNNLSNLGIFIVISLLTVSMNGIDYMNFLVIKQFILAAISGTISTLSVYYSIKSLTKVDISKVAIFSYCQIPLNVLSGIIFFHENLNFYEFIILSIITSTLLICNYYGK